ncbi:MAG: hypothetical protein IT350_07460 [Deltaproteobacteria bacterium]|nr:hypothetical protein [Deltaproteobacteria bacterium]
MVKGLEIFREHFRLLADRYLLIGGTACDLAMNAAGVEFRATKDLDIVLCVETLDAAFVTAFWEFVRAGGYQARRKEMGGRQCYRFQNPTDADYPSMLELFTRKPDLLDLPEGAHLTPIPMGDEVSSLSAILMEDDYYRFIQGGRKSAEGLTYLGPEHLLPLKARAWLDLTARTAEGQPADGRDVRKHGNDVYRLYQILDPDFAGDVPETVRHDLRNFVTRMRDETIDLKALGVRGADRDSILEEIRRIYRLGT